MAMIIDLAAFHDRMKRLRDAPAKMHRVALHRFGEYLTPVIKARLPGTQHTLAKSVDFKASADEMVVGSRKPWARITHFGGDIWASGQDKYKAPAPPLRSRKGTLSRVTGKAINYLAIPIGDAKKKHGTLSPHDYKNTFVFKSKKGNLLVAQKTEATLSATTGGIKFGFRQPGTSNQNSKFGKGKKGAIRLLFLLRAMVTLKKHPYMYIGVKDRAEFSRIIKETLAGK